MSAEVVPSGASSVRERSRQAVRTHVETVALGLFREHGYDRVTVDAIAGAAGMSSRTFFRYFATKEDVVIGDPMTFGGRLRDHLRDRPGDENAAEALCRALEQLAGDIVANPTGLEIAKIMMSTAALRARRTEKQRVWVDLLLPDVLARLGRRPRRHLVAVTLITGLLAALDAALVEWAALDGRVALPKLLSVALDALA